MFRRMLQSATLALLAVAVTLLAGCSSTITVKASASVGPSGNAVTIRVTSQGNPVVFIIVVDNRDGVQFVRGNLSNKGASSWNGADMAPGDHSYTVFWLPQNGRDVQSVTDEELLLSSKRVSGKFAIP